MVEPRQSSAARIAAGSVAVAVAVLTLKAIAWWVTGSVALYADALESIVNVAAALAALLAVRLSALPADANHPYGHSKAEYFSAVLEGALIIVAALLILHETWAAYLAPRAPEQAGIGLAVAAVASGINAVWAFFLTRRGKALRSPALMADARHLWSDVVTSVGVLVGVGLVALTGLFSGGKLLRESVGGLMDEAVPPATLERIRRIVAEQASGAIEAHDLRSRHAGRHTFLEFHLVVPGDMSVRESHEICDRIEAALKAELEGAIITIHVEPEAKAKQQGVPVL
jgi:cation diffusion facilitator family transporter